MKQSTIFQTAIGRTLGPYIFRVNHKILSAVVVLRLGHGDDGKAVLVLLLVVLVGLFVQRKGRTRPESMMTNATPEIEIRFKYATNLT